MSDQSYEEQFPNQARVDRIQILVASLSGWHSDEPESSPFRWAEEALDETRALSRAGLDRNWQAENRELDAIAARLRGTLKDVRSELATATENVRWMQDQLNEANRKLESDRKRFAREIAEAKREQPASA